MANQPPTDSSTPIVAFRPTRGSAPISVDLFNATTDALAIAFQATVLFHDSASGPITLPQLRVRWNASERGARAARRTLIDCGFWVEIDERQPNGRFKRSTVFAETRLGPDELAEIASQCSVSSRLRSGGGDYLVGPNGELNNRDGIDAASANVSAGRTETASAHTRSGSTEVAAMHTRHDQEVSETEVAAMHTRHDQERQGFSAGRTEAAAMQPETYASSSSCKEDDDKKHACMDELDKFWKLINSSVAVVDPRGRSSVKSQVQTALNSGWTTETLTEWVRGQLAAARSRTGVRSPGGFVVSVLREIPAVVETAGPAEPTSDIPEWCGQCDDPEVRQYMGDDGQVYRCATCNIEALRRRRARREHGLIQTDQHRAGGTTRAGSSLAELGLTG